jgi:hypothetical protein
MNKRIQTYINRIRNPHKLEYARVYLAYLRNPVGESPDYPGLSYMAAQAVRMNLRLELDIAAQA